jgi:hypothetical protein
METPRAARIPADGSTEDLQRAAQIPTDGSGAARGGAGLPRGGGGARQSRRRGRRWSVTTPPEKIPYYRLTTPFGH